MSKTIHPASTRPDPVGCPCRIGTRSQSTVRLAASVFATACLIAGCTQEEQQKFVDALVMSAADTISIAVDFIASLVRQGLAAFLL